MSASYRNTDDGGPYWTSSYYPGSQPGWQKFAPPLHAPRVEMRDGHSASTSQTAVSSVSHETQSTMARLSPTIWIAGQSAYNQETVSQPVLTYNPHSANQSIHTAYDPARASQAAYNPYGTTTVSQDGYGPALASQPAYNTITANQIVYDPTGVNQGVYNHVTSQPVYNQTQGMINQPLSNQPVGNLSVYNPGGASYSASSATAAVRGASVQLFPISSYGHRTSFAVASPAQVQTNNNSDGIQSFIEYQKSIAVASQTFQSYQTASEQQQQVAYQPPYPPTDFQTYQSFRLSQQQSNPVYAQPIQPPAPQTFATPLHQPAMVVPMQQPSITSAIAPVLQQQQQPPVASAIAPVLQQQQQTLMASAIAPVLQQQPPPVASAVAPALQQPQAPNNVTSRPSFSSPPRPSFASPLRPSFISPTQQQALSQSSRTPRMPQKFETSRGRGAPRGSPMQWPHPQNPQKFGEDKVVRTTFIRPQRMRFERPMGRGFVSTNTRGLDMEIQRYYREQKQSDEMLRRKEDVRVTLERVIQDRMASRDLTVHLFGSSVNGFGSRTSDADYSVLTLGIRNEGFRGGQLRILESIFRQFKRAPITDGNVQFGRFFLIRAKIPILRFKFWGRVEADLSVDNTDGVKNSAMLQAFAEFDRRVGPLVLIIKDWSKQCGINNAPAGYLSSYSVVLMAIFFLQCCSPPVVPCFKAEYQQQETLKSLDYTDTTGLKSVLASSTFVRRNESDLGSLLLEFFKFYNDFDFNCVISVRCGSKLMKAEKWAKEICIEEPFCRDNTARALQNYNFSMVKKRFAKAMADLEQKPHVSALVRVR